jgi:glycosyltransferase involved in cell wall biosynthesis
MTKPYLSCVIRTTSARARLCANIVRLLQSYKAEAPPFEIIFVVDQDDYDVPHALRPHYPDDTPWVEVRAPGRQPGEQTWQYLHRKYRAGFAGAKGEWIVCVDDDDWFGPRRLTSLVDEQADVACLSRVLVHELRSPTRRTYLRKMHRPGLLESTVSFRRKLLDAVPFVQPELGLWVNHVYDQGFKVARRITTQHVMFLHGANADLGAGRDGLRVGADDTVHDGPAEYRVIGARRTTADTIGEAELQQWEAAVGPA